MTDATNKNNLAVSLRPALAGDVACVRAILAAAANDLTARCGLGHWSAVRSAETLRKYADDGELYLIEADGRAVGTFRLTDRKIGFYRSDWFANPADPAFYVLDMAIHPEHQHRGIGRGSMGSADELAFSRGLKAIRLDAYTGLAGAGGFYRKCGYRLVHEGAFNGVPLEYYERLVEPGR
jgi:GNAT superfamily N-acetyltransferase